MFTLHYILILAAFITALLAALQLSTPRINLIATALALFFLSLLVTGCAQPGQPRVDNAATRTGQNLLGAVATVFQDYADVKENGVASLWSISKGVNAYSQAVNGVTDIKQLIVDWKATKGDGNLLTRIGAVLNNSDAPAQTKALVVAKAAEMVAANKGP